MYLNMALMQRVPQKTKPSYAHKWIKGYGYVNTEVKLLLRSLELEQYDNAALRPKKGCAFLLYKV